LLVPTSTPRWNGSSARTRYRDTVAFPRYASSIDPVRVTENVPDGEAVGSGGAYGVVAVLGPNVGFGMWYVAWTWG
jgi:hypothetical protein